MLVTAEPDVAEVSCDRCGANLRVAGADPHAAWLTAQAAGWQTEQLGGVWWHRCPPCARRFG